MKVTMVSVPLRIPKLMCRGRINSQCKDKGPDKLKVTTKLIRMSRCLQQQHPCGITMFMGAALIPITMCIESPNVIKNTSRVTASII